MDSPNSETIQTRFSTPVSELDDHRRHPASLPRADNAVMASTPARVSISLSPAGPGHTVPISETIQMSRDLRQNSVTARDFEEAITDDDKSAVGVPNNNRLEPGDFNSPVKTRRPTLRLPSFDELPVKTRTESSSSRSSSPPNSVEAFADARARRRERAGTVNSKAGSDQDIGPQRAPSTVAHHRRGTFSDQSARNAAESDNISCQQVRAEEDVCFPQPEESSKAYIIDFEALEEFVAENEKAKDKNKKSDGMSIHKHEPRTFGDLRPHVDQAPHATTKQDTGLQPGLISQDSILDEKKIVIDDTGITTEFNENLTGLQGVSADTTRFSFFSSELESTIHAPELGDLIMPGEIFRDLFELGPDGGVWWLDVTNPSEEEVNALSKAFSIHPLTCEDIKTQEAREKVELFHQYYFVCFRSFYQMDKESDNYLDPVNVYVIVFREGVLSFTFCQSPHASNVRKRIGRLRDYVSLSSDWICYAMIDDIVDSFSPAIRDIECQTDVIEDQVFVARAEDFSTLLRQIGECRKKDLSLMRLLGGKADVIKGFAKRCNEQYSITPRSDIGLYLGDIQDHVVTMINTLGHVEKMLSRCHSNYLAQLSVDNLVQGNRANVVLSKITLIATIIVPLNLICGLFGMNVPVPGRSSDGLGWFFGIVGLIFGLTAVCLFAARRVKFI